MKKCWIYEENDGNRAVRIPLEIHLAPGKWCATKRSCL